MRNQKGFTVQEMVIAMAISGIVLAGLISAFSYVRQTRQRLDMHNEQSKLNSEIQSMVASSASCSVALVDPANSVDPLGSPLPIKAGNYVEGGALTPTAKIVDLKVLVNTAVPVIHDPAANLDRYKGYIRTQVATQVNGTTVLSPLKTVPVVLSVDPTTHKIATCESADNEAVLCQRLGRVYNPTAPDGERCQPTDQCDFGGSFTDPATPGGFKNFATNDYTCPTNYTQQRSGTIIVAEHSGKYQAYDTGYAVYNCTRCGATTIFPQDPSVTSAPIHLDGFADVNADAADAEAANASQYSDLASILSGFHFW